MKSMSFENSLIIFVVNYFRLFSQKYPSITTVVAIFVNNSDSMVELTKPAEKLVDVGNGSLDDERLGPSPTS